MPAASRREADRPNLADPLQADARNEPLPRPVRRQDRRAKLECERQARAVGQREPALPRARAQTVRRVRLLRVERHHTKLEPVERLMDTVLGKPRVVRFATTSLWSTAPITAPTASASATRAAPASSCNRARSAEASKISVTRAAPGRAVRRSTHRPTTDRRARIAYERLRATNGRLHRGDVQLVIHDPQHEVGPVADTKRPADMGGNHDVTATRAHAHHRSCHVATIVDVTPSRQTRTRSAWAVPVNADRRPYNTSTRAPCPGAPARRASRVISVASSASASAT